MWWQFFNMIQGTLNVCVCVCTPQGVLIGLGQNTTTFVRWVYKWIDGLKVPGHRNIGVIPYKKKDVETDS